MQQPGRSPSESLELRRQYQRYNSTGCYVDVRSLTHERFVNSPMLFLPYPPKRDSLLCVARHKAVTRTWDAPLSKALRPGFSVSGVEPSGVCFSWYCQPSSRSLGKLSSNRSSLKRTVLEQGSSRSFFLTKNDHWLPAGAGGNSSPSMSNNDLMRCFIRTISLTKVSRSWVRWRSSRYKGVGTWMPLSCPPRRFSEIPRLSSRLVFTLCPGALGIIDGEAIKHG